MRGLRRLGIDDSVIPLLDLIDATRSLGSVVSETNSLE